MREYSYPAVRVKQTTDGPWVVLFAAPATEIYAWAGIPQKATIGDSENLGFQRTDNRPRIERLVEFYSNNANIVQNPLLCALQNADQIEFVPDPSSENDDHDSRIGQIVIRSDALEERSLTDLIAGVREQIEDRIPELRQSKVSLEKLATLRAQAVVEGLTDDDEEERVSDYTDEDTGGNGDGGWDSKESDIEDAEILVSEESHIQEFWEDLAAREQLLRELDPDLRLDSFAGYSRDAMEVYLRPAVLVDGQHRLLGAVTAAERLAGNPQNISQIADDIDAGEDPNDVQAKLEHNLVRHLPISLLMTASPAEHVFQFVVVNQKATPIGRPLLGTIVSTSLSNTELAGVASRLEQAGVHLGDSRAISYMARESFSPFYQRVRRGLGETGDRLDWLVLGSLIEIFRKLRGGRLYHESTDWADIWRRRHFESSSIVADYAKYGCADPYEYWSSLSGPWRRVFIRFWSEVRDKLSNVNVVETGNYWGAPRSSNLFNKVTLTILTADFFHFLCETRSAIDDDDSVDAYVAEWLTDVNPSYFSRNWNLVGIKKDSVGIRKQWSYLWSEYRPDPRQVPSVKMFSRPKGD
jgi:hypothetical protein